MTTEKLKYLKEKLMIFFREKNNAILIVDSAKTDDGDFIAIVNPTHQLGRIRITSSNIPVWANENDTILLKLEKETGRTSREIFEKIVEILS